VLRRPCVKGYTINMATKKERELELKLAKLQGVVQGMMLCLPHLHGGQEPVGGNLVGVDEFDDEDEGKGKVGFR
jgi:hypothetical protein